MPSAFARSIEQQVRRDYSDRVNEGTFGPHELEIAANILVKRTSVSESTSRLEALGPLVVTADYAFVYASPMTAFVIPTQWARVSLYGIFVS